MKIGQDVYFSNGCPAADAYIGPISTDSLQLSVDFCNLGSEGVFQDCTAEAYFACGSAVGGDRRLSEAVGVEVSIGSDDATVMLVMAFTEGVGEQIKRALCDRIGVCPGPLEREGSRHCPAFNDDVFGSVIKSVVNAEE